VLFTPATNRRLIQATGLIDTLNQNALPLTVLVPDNVLHLQFASYVGNGVMAACT
jgi:hypothetical protein